MNWEQVRGNWDQFKGEVKARWGKLTDDDLALIDGERDKLVGRLEELYGITKEEAEKKVDELK
ncbi:CsbD family protein [Thiorhodococcus minor]|uniref:CsbD family protein n=1 Tax=Thiorhodococcus minor TaxID=57489 RepID=A0A6M0JV05_9GAMM|nr:CsbD family protein [Thiorhodococcus minor]NEV61380.1 CsbD family protein [Thiorhodococcus minor]